MVLGLGEIDQQPDHCPYQPKAAVLHVVAWLYGLLTTAKKKGYEYLQCLDKESLTKNLNTRMAPHFDIGGCKKVAFASDLASRTCQSH